MTSFKDPKLQRQWDRLRWVLLFLLSSSLLGLLFRWEEWVLSQDIELEASADLLHDLTWPIFDHREKAFTLRCHNNCSNNHAGGVPPCDPSKETYCRQCVDGFIGFDCSMPLCPKCRVPDVVLIGVQKGGTTALSTYLSLNPLFLTSRKDHFFDDNWDRSLIWYFSLWDYHLDTFDPTTTTTSSSPTIDEDDDDDDNDDDDDDDMEEDEFNDENEEEEEEELKELKEENVMRSEETLLKDFLSTSTSSSSSSSSSTIRSRIKLGGSPKYIVSDLAISRLYALHPTVRFILLLRNPTTRAYSGVLMNERKGYFTHNLTDSERSLLNLLIKKSHLNNKNNNDDKVHDGSDEEDELSHLVDGEGLFNEQQQIKWRAFSNNDNPKVKALKNELKKKLAESNEQHAFNPIDSEHILLRGVELVQACLIEASSRHQQQHEEQKESFFRSLVSIEMEELIRERGTDVQAYFEWQACFASDAPLVSSWSNLQTMYPDHFSELTNRPGFDNEGDGAVVQIKVNGNDNNNSNHQNVIIRSLGWSSIVRGLYFHQLNEWFTYFNTSQFLIVRSEELLQSTQPTLDQVHQWLGAPPFNYKKEDLGVLNSAPSSQPTMTAKTRTVLDEFYIPYNQKLIRLTQRSDLQW